MSWILDECELVLRGQGYSTLRISGPDALAFEDDVLMGFVLDYASVPELIAKWQVNQTDLLSRFSPALRVVREKAWNVYFCLFTELAPSSPDDRFDLELIEADLQNTRKIPRHSLKTPSDLVTALYPMLPIQSRAQIVGDGFDERLARQLEIVVAGPAANLFLSDAEEAVVGQALIEAAK